MKQALLFSFFLLFSSALFGQQRKANNLYKDKRFAEAIPYFESLIKKDPSTKYQAKLASCYRKTNQLEKAEVLYNEIVQKKRFNSRILYRYGEVLMGLGRYDEAKSWFLKYAEKNPRDERGMQKAEACDYVKTIQPYFTSVKFIPIPFNSDADDSNPTYYKGKIYFSSDRKSGFNVLKKKSGWTGRDYSKIYQVEWPGSNMFSAPEALSFRINNINKNAGKPSFSKAGDVYFTRNTNTASKDGTFKLHIYHTKLLANGKWEKPKALSFCQLSINYLHPSVSEDGQTLYFASNRGGGEGGMDIFMSNKVGSTWTRPIALGIPINTPEHEAFPYIHPSGKLFFSSKGHNGFGGFDIFMTEKDEDGNWHTPINLGSPINSSGDDIGFYVDSLMGTSLFASNRGGDNDDIYLCHFAAFDSLAQNSTQMENKINDTTLVATEFEEETGVQNIPSEVDSSETFLERPDIEVPFEEDFDRETFEVTYQRKYKEIGIDILPGDTIYLVAPTYETDYFEVPNFLAGQLDQLVPAMYLSKNLTYTIYSFSDESKEIFSGRTIVRKRVEAIKDYLVQRHILSASIKVEGISPKNSEKFPIFASKEKIIILVESTN